MNYLGTWLLRVTFAIALISFFLIILYRKTEAKKHIGIRLGLLSCSGVLLSSGLLLFALVTGDYSLEFVFHNTETSLPIIYKISALWSGSSGSLLLWCSIFSILLILLYFKEKNSTSIKNIFSIVLAIIIIFMVMVTFINNPFSYVTSETDGFGLSPALQSIGMVVHPPVIFVGFAFFFIAFAYMFTDLKERGQANKQIIWKYTLWGWILLTLGIILGGAWAYSELGWGGYWAWDAIENSSLVNWLLATAFLHNISRKDSDVKNNRVNFALISSTVLTILIGTFIVRSGVLESVHGYNNEGITLFFGLVLAVLVMIVSIFYFKYKANSNGITNKEQQDKTIIKWYKFVIQPSNIIMILFVGMAAIIFLATIFPLYGWIFTDNPSDIITYNFYEFSFGIWGLLILTLIGVCPRLFSGNRTLLIPGAIAGVITFTILSITNDYTVLTRTSLAICTVIIIAMIIDVILNYKKFTSRTYLSFFILHMAIVLIALGFAGSRGMSYSNEKVLSKNDVIEIQNYTLTYRNLKWSEDTGTITATAEIVTQGPWGSKVLRPKLTYYKKMDMNHSRALIKMGIQEDLYLIFEGLDEEENMLLKVMIMKWVSLVWVGGFLLIMGGVLEYRFRSKAYTNSLIHNNISV